LIGEESYLALQDKKKVINDGKEKIINKRSGFAKNIAFSFDIYGWTAGIDINYRAKPPAKLGRMAKAMLSIY